MKKLIFTFAILFFGFFAQAQQDCGLVAIPVPYKFCISKTLGSSNTDVLFYLHGGGGSEENGQGVIDSLKETWAQQDHQAPVVVSISFGEFWLLVKRNGSPNSGLLEVFKDFVIPEMEKRAVGGPARRRLLAGHSMGGFNSAQLLFNTSAGFFAKAALVCPAIVNLSPWASQDKVAEHARYLGVPVAVLNSLSQIVKQFVSDEAFYQAEVDPINLAKTQLFEKSTVFVAVNEDDRAFRDGGEKFIKAAGNSLPISSQIWPGGHCSTDTRKLAEFLK